MCINITLSRDGQRSHPLYAVFMSLLYFLQVLDSDVTGRKKIEVIQLQGHLFFGNISLFGESVKKIIQSNPAGELPFIVSSSNDLILGCPPLRCNSSTTCFAHVFVDAKGNY